jgi:hypothetical protein
MIRQILILLLLCSTCFAEFDYNELDNYDKLTPAQAKKVQEQYQYCIESASYMSVGDTEKYCKAAMNMLISVKELMAIEQEIIVVGYGDTHDERLLDAFNTAIAETYGVHVSSLIEVENGELTKESIQTSSVAYIRSYKIISETDSVITIQAIVDMKMRGTEQNAE